MLSCNAKRRVFAEFVTSWDGEGDGLFFASCMHPSSVTKPLGVFLPNQKYFTHFIGLGINPPRREVSVVY